MSTKEQLKTVVTQTNYNNADKTTVSNAGQSSDQQGYVPLRQVGGTYMDASAIINKKNVFVTPEYMDLLVNGFKLAELKHDVKSLAYVIMPNHFYWVFRLSEKSDDPASVYGEVKKNVTLEIIKNLVEESKGDDYQYKLLDLFENNEKVSRSKPRKILWDFKQEAKKYDNVKRYKVWEAKSKLFLLNNEDKLMKNIQYVLDAPVRDRWQFVEKAQDYPYLYVSEEILEKLAA